MKKIAVILILLTLISCNKKVNNIYNVNLDLRKEINNVIIEEFHLNDTLTIESLYVFTVTDQ